VKQLFGEFFNHRVRALMRKEFNQIRHDRRLALSLVLPPTVQLVLFGFALSANVTNLRLGVVDENATVASRELIAALGESKSFRVAGYYSSAGSLGDALNLGELDAGVVIPFQYARDLERGRTATVQFILNAMNANTAAIGQGYAKAVIETLNRQLAQETPPNAFLQAAGRPANRRGQVLLQPAFLYNPGLVDSWFVATGVFGLLLILNSSLVASAAMVREREAGTIEQLLMSPASISEIIAAKIAPLFLLLCLTMLVALGTIKFAFKTPFQGNLLLVLFGGALCILAGIGIGTVIATFSRSAQQAQLTSFFVNPPLTSLSGALNPVEAMPGWLQPLTILNPIHHFATIVRSSLLKGSGIATLWPNFLALFVFALVLFLLSLWRFRKQLT
jgi:ABC-2 type transport system permease protein